MSNSESFFPIFWFSHLFGCEEDPRTINTNFRFTIAEDGETMLVSCHRNGMIYKCGRLKKKAFCNFKEFEPRGGGKLHIVCGNGENSYPPHYTDFISAQNYPEFDGATFQISSSAKGTQNIDSQTSVANGIRDYTFDFNQGAMGSVATGHAALYRNYCCSQILDLLQNTPFDTRNGFIQIDDEEELDRIRNLDFDWNDPSNYYIGIQRNIEVVIRRDESYFLKYSINTENRPIVHYCFCLKMDFANDIISCDYTKMLARIILEYQYKMAILSAWENSLLYPDRPGSRVLFLLPLGTECGTSRRVVSEAIEACKDLIVDSGLDVYLSCYTPFSFKKCKEVLKHVVDETQGSIILTKKVAKEDLAFYQPCGVDCCILLIVIIITLVVFILFVSKFGKIDKMYSF